MKIADKKTQPTVSKYAEMCACYYFRVNKHEEYERKALIKQYSDLRATFRWENEQNEYKILHGMIKHFIRKASLLYLEHYDLTKKEKNHIQFVLDRIDAAYMPGEINALVKKAYEATSRFPDQTNIFWE
ncbi:MAG: hypothetical protein WCH34_03245 [Bacteroidota bacterium]